MPFRILYKLLLRTFAAITACAVATLSAPVASASTLGSTSDPQCESVSELAKSITGVIDDTLGTPPLLVTWSAPKMSAPAGTPRSTAIRYSVRVDAHGSPHTSTASVRGTPSDQWQDAIKVAMARNTYTPARIRGCAVEGTVVLPMEVSNTGVLVEPSAMKLPPIERLTPVCREARLRAMKTSNASVDEKRYPPFPRAILLPPMPIPPDMKSSNITLIAKVDADGWAVTDSSRIEGARNRNYAKQILAILNDFSFRPATDGNGCAVAGTWEVDFKM